MRALRLFSLLAAACAALAAPRAVSADDAPAAVGDTVVQKWKGGAKACFLLMFDDGWPSAIDVAVPELEKRGLVATYYIVPEKGEFKAREKAWREEAWKRGAVYGNHTMTHHGVRDYEHARTEIGGCTDWILDVVPGKRPRLVSYGQPGVDKGKWNITREELQRILDEWHMVERPDFRGHGAVYHLKTCDDMLALADRAIASGGMEYVVFHGLEHKAPWRTWQDFWAMKQDIVFPFFDAIAERRDRGDLWVTDHISCHQYETERATARVEKLQVAPGGRGVRFTLSCDADPALYDLPLTLRTRVPAQWRKATVKRGANVLATVPVEDGVVQYEVAPGPEPVTLLPAP